MNPLKWADTVKQLIDMSNKGKGKIDSRGNSTRDTRYRNWSDADFINILKELNLYAETKITNSSNLINSNSDQISNLKIDFTQIEDLNNLTLLIKSFKRKECVDNLISSIRKFYKNIPIIVVDDSVELETEILPNYDYDENIKTYNIPFDSGLSAGRNYGVSKIETDYFVLLDDDFEFTERTDLNKWLKILKISDLDILGGLVLEKNKSIEYFGLLSNENKTLIYKK
jgi:hypothetical protein